MTECEICNTPISGGSAFTCTYCGGTFCPAHRLPFNHACPRIEEWKRGKPEKEKRSREKRLVRGIRMDQKKVVAGAVILLFLALLFVVVFSGW